DLVHEEDVVLLEPGQDGRHVALALERRPGDAADADAELLAHDVGEAGLAEPGRTDEQDVVERLAARARRLERDGELLLHARLPDKIIEPARAQRALELFLAAVLEDGGQLRAHAAFLNARRTRSSAGRSASTSDSA